MERNLNTGKRRLNTADLTYTSLMAALAIILSYFPEIPFPMPVAPWLKLDFAFVPMLLIGFSMGPVYSVMTLLITNVVRLLGTATFGVGQLANILMGLSFLALPAFLYQKRRTLKTALLGTMIGIVLMTVMGVVTNRYLLVPVLLGDKIATFPMTDYLIKAIIPFNLIKGGINGAITFVLYKRLSKILKGAEKEADVSSQNK